MVDHFFEQKVGQFRLALRQIATKLAFHPQFNIFLGDNGSGKTSLLESIYFLALGRSFRTNKINNLINFDLLWKTFIKEIVIYCDTNKIKTKLRTLEAYTTFHKLQNYNIAHIITDM